MPALRRTVTLLLALAAIGVTPLTAATTPAARAAACTDVEIVFARGTGEPRGLGSVGRPFVAGLTGELSGRSVSSYAVDYPASANQNAAPGANDLVARVAEVAASCPDTRFVLGGYSQGATVVNQALGIRTGFANGRSLSSDLGGRVAAVVVWGSPLNASGRTIAGSAPTYANRTREYCNSADPVCGRRGSTPGGHLSYRTNGTVSAGARFAADRVGTAD